MKKVSFMVALLAVIQILLGSRIAQAQNHRLGQDRHDDRRTVEEALDVAGEDIGEELQELFAQLEDTAEEIGERFERWAEENAEELEAWSEKHGQQWERFGEQFGRTMEGIAGDQEGIWAQWAERYERDLQRWENDLERDELSAENIGRFVDDNLEALSRMPLGQLVDQALEDGVGELRNAPWESLEELGLLAKDALQEPIEELAELTIDGAKTRRALDRSAEKMGRSLERLKDDINRNISDSDLQDLLQDEELRDEDPRIRRFKELLERDGITKQQRQKIEEMIDAIRSSDQARPEAKRGVVDVPRRDQILEKIEREKKRHANALDDFNSDLRRSSEDSLQQRRRQADTEWQKKDSRIPKRPDGRSLDLPPRSGNADQFKMFRDGDSRQPRNQKPSLHRNPNKKTNRAGTDDESEHDWAEDDEEEAEETDRESTDDRVGEDKKMKAIDALLRQVEELRKEVENLKRDRS